MAEIGECVLHYYAMELVNKHSQLGVMAYSNVLEHNLHALVGGPKIRAFSAQLRHFLALYSFVRLRLISSPQMHPDHGPEIAVGKIAASAVHFNSKEFPPLPASPSRP